jgi:hypothetical protein
VPGVGAFIMTCLVFLACSAKDLRNVNKLHSVLFLGEVCGQDN